MGGGTGDNGRMHVPTDAFGGMSPEYKAASALKNLFTMVAVRVVMAQEMGYDNEGGAMTPTYKGLQDFLDENPLRDGNKWLEQLMHHDDNNMRLTALRLLEVRRAYASGQFDFGGMHDLAVAELTKENDRLMAPGAPGTARWMTTPSGPRWRRSRGRTRLSARWRENSPRRR